jgi:predicted acyl esterase
MTRLDEIRELMGAIWPVLKRALRSGQILRPQCELEEPHPDILCEYDVEIPLSDGTHATANVFRSRTAADRDEKVPAILCAHPYDNHLIPALGKTPLGGPPQQYRMIPQAGRPTFSTLTSWEAPDPNFWIPAGYALVNMNMPGYANSGGKPTLFSPQQNEAFAEGIDWIGARDWCTGKVGLNGVSYLAISQYAVAAGQTTRGVPTCLRAVCPWEGITNLYHDLFFEGGVREKGFPVFWWHTEVRPTINCSLEEFIESEGLRPQEIAEIHPFYDDYWKEKTPDLDAIELPMLVCASFSDQGLHTRGSFRAFRRARSSEKWVYTHRDLKWDAYYSREVEKLTRDFFDCFLKDERENGFLDRAPVRLEVRASRDAIHEVREEREWPLARTDYQQLFLPGRGQRLGTQPESEGNELCYHARSGELRFQYIFDRDTELSGYLKLSLWVEARSTNESRAAPDDMVLFIGVDKLDRAGSRVPFFGSVGNHADLMSRGLIAASRRALDESQSEPWEPVLTGEKEEKLQPGEIVRLEIPLNPTSTFFAEGEGLRLMIAPNEIVASPPFAKDNDCNRGLHVIHVGPEQPSHLLIPVIPGRP